VLGPGAAAQNAHQRLHVPVPVAWGWQWIDSGSGWVAVDEWQWLTQWQWHGWQWLAVDDSGGVAGEKMERIGWVLSELRVVVAAIDSDSGSDGQW
jgi:hypothetical protein